LRRDGKNHTIRQLAERKPAQNMLVGRACPTEVVQAGKTYRRPLC